MSRNSNNSDLSYDTKIIITVLALIFVFPAGVILMWIWTNWPNWIRLIITIFPIIIILFVFGLLGAIFTLIPKDAWHTTSSYSVSQ